MSMIDPEESYSSTGGAPEGVARGVIIDHGTQIFGNGKGE